MEMDIMVEVISFVLHSLTCDKAPVEYIKEKYQVFFYSQVFFSWLRLNMLIN